MKTSIVGYPHIGKLRELKFATEKYFKNKISAEELEESAKAIRKDQWQVQADSGLDFIPSNDFSFYDGVLDTAVLFNIVPTRYRELDLSPLDTYFAQARGYQGEKGDVVALPMKKWFNTNYHYIVPEIEDDTDIRLVGSKPFDEYEEAKALNIETKPVVTGAFTLLKLATYSGEKQASDFIEAVINAYSDLLARFDELGAEWVQFDEPYIVYDLSSEEKELFNKLYEAILSHKGNSKVLVQTYFGDVRDCYDLLQQLDFDGIGLDFIEGKQTAALIEENGFSSDKTLFAGLINGKNIWRNNYRKTLKVLEQLESNGIDIVLNTSCSLLHVPYSLANETELSDEQKRYFAFAEEKLDELNELKQIQNGEKSLDDIEVIDVDEERPNSRDQEVRDRVKAITKDDFERKPAFAEREKIQKDAFQLPLFLTTTIGSFPQTKEVRKNRSDFRKGNISEDEYKAFNKEKIREWIEKEEEIGFDVLVHGEFERNDMVEFFGEHFNGFLFTKKAWVQSYGTRCVKPPIIWGDVSREHAVTVEWSAYAQSLTDKPVKGMLTGPVTILNWSFPREDISVEESTYQVALAIREEVLDLEANGIRIIQIDEPALREKLPLRKSDWYGEYLDWAVPAFRLVHSGVKPETQIHTHMCYSEFNDIIKAIDGMDADVITFEASRSDLKILDSLQANNFQTEVGPGVYDIHSPRVPSKDEIVATLKAIAEKVPVEKIWVNPDCGLKTRAVDEVIPSLENLVAAARELRGSY